MARGPTGCRENKFNPTQGNVQMLLKYRIYNCLFFTHNGDKVYQQ